MEMRRATNSSRDAEAFHGLPEASGKERWPAFRRRQIQMSGILSFMDGNDYDLPPDQEPAGDNQ